MSNQRPVVLSMYDARIVAKSLSQKLLLGLTADNILNPTAEIALQILTQFARVILNVSEQSMNTLPLSADADHDHELHRKSVPLVITYQCMKAFIKDNTDGKLDLTMCDLTTPAKVPNRFRKLASFLYDFIRLHEFASPIFNDICDEFSDRKLQMEEVQEELVATENKKKELLAKQNTRKRRENELMNDHNKLKTELNNVVNQYMKNSEQSTEIDKQHEETIRQIEDVEKEILTGKKTVEHLNEEVLSSPQELKREMAERKAHIEQLKECLKVSKQNLQEKLEARDICITAEKNVPVVIEKIGVWSEVRDDILDLIDTVDENLRKLKEMQEQLAFTADKKKNVGERIIEQTQMHEQLRNEHLQRTQELQGNIDEITKKIADLGKNKPDVSRDISKKRQELISAKNSHSETVAQITNSCQDAISKFRKIDSQFQNIQRVSLEKKNAVQRAKDRLQTACNGRLPSDYTFSTSSINDSENVEPLSPITPSDFNVFNN